jgi:ATP-dependent DNA ligase
LRTGTRHRGYLPGTHGLDSTIVGYYKGDDLIYVARVRNGFVPASWRHLFEKLRPLVIPQCPFANLPERHRSRWGEGLTANDMKKCVGSGLHWWLKSNFWSGRRATI